jgi:hypothetical protein
MSRIIRAEHPQLGTFFAAVDHTAHHVEGRVAQTRLGAFVGPFPSEQAACEALLAVGAVLSTDKSSAKRAGDDRTSANSRRPG